MGSAIATLDLETPVAVPLAEGVAELRLEMALSLLSQAGWVPPAGMSPGSAEWMQAVIDGLCDLSSRDALTGLANRRQFEAAIAREIDRVARVGEPALLLIADIDHFKKVNDTYGHPMGDRVIKSLALFLKQRLRKTDHIGRYGGEEFAVVLPDTDEQSALKVLEEIRQRFAEIHYPAQPQDLSCTFSCGIAMLQPGLDGNALSKRADEALYKAKHGGRNRVELY